MNERQDNSLREAVDEDLPDVGGELFGVGVDPRVHLPLDRAQVHRPLDYVVVVMKTCWKNHPYVSCWKKRVSTQQSFTNNCPGRCYGRFYVLFFKHNDKSYPLQAGKFNSQDSQKCNPHEDPGHLIVANTSI